MALEIRTEQLPKYRLLLDALSNRIRKFDNGLWLFITDFLNVKHHYCFTFQYDDRANYPGVTMTMEEFAWFIAAPHQKKRGQESRFGSIAVVVDGDQLLLSKRVATPAVTLGSAQTWSIEIQVSMHNAIYRTGKDIIESLRKKQQTNLGLSANSILNRAGLKQLMIACARRVDKYFYSYCNGFDIYVT